jgi:hypothetical protein
VKSDAGNDKQLNIKLVLRSGERGKYVGDLSKNDRLIFSDTVRIDSARSRKKFAEACAAALQREFGQEWRAEHGEKARELVERKCLAKIGQERAKAVIRDNSSKTEKKSQVKLLENVSLADVQCALLEIVSSPYCGDVLEISLATVLNGTVQDDGLVWEIIVSEPSTGKTETATGVKHEPKVTFLDSLTDKAFITGFVNHDGSSPPDLLSELDGRCLLVKDLTPLFSEREEIVKGVLGAMVSIYDGSYARQTGTRSRVQYDARFSFIGCITPQGIEKHQRYMRQMGSRFLFYRIPNLTLAEEQDGMNQILDDPNRKTKVERYRLVCSSFLHQLISGKPPAIEPTPDQKEIFKNLALLVSRGRAITIGSNYNDNEDTGFQKEGPFRLVSQLKALAINLARVHQRSVITEHEMELVRRVAISTIPPYSGFCLGAVSKLDQPHAKRGFDRNRLCERKHVQDYGTRAANRTG